MTRTATDSSPPSAELEPAVGRTERGTVTISDRVVQKVAARAAIEIEDAGAAAPRILGRSLAGLANASPAGIRSTSLDALPKANADVDGSLVALDLQLSVRWPASIPGTTRKVRDHVSARVTELTGLTVTEVQIQVIDLVTDLPAPPRVK